MERQQRHTSADVKILLLNILLVENWAPTVVSQLSWEFPMHFAVG